MIINEFFKTALQHSKWRWFVLLLVLVYIVSPIDLLPEAVFAPIGLIDDSVLLSFIVSALVAVRKERKLKNNKNGNDNL